jgi:hypothetical protein
VIAFFMVTLYPYRLGSAPAYQVLGAGGMLAAQSSVESAAKVEYKGISFAPVPSA